MHRDEIAAKDRRLSLSCHVQFWTLWWPLKADYSQSPTLTDISVLREQEDTVYHCGTQRRGGYPLDVLQNGLAKRGCPWDRRWSGSCQRGGAQLFYLTLLTFWQTVMRKTIQSTWKIRVAFFFNGVKFLASGFWNICLYFNVKPKLIIDVKTVCSSQD